MGFLHATPEGRSLSRAKFLQRERLPHGLPDIEAGEYLIVCLTGEGGLGWCHSDGMAGLVPHSWVEIDAYARMTGAICEPWEARQLRAMSLAYCDGNRHGSKPGVVAPVHEDDPAADLGLEAERRMVSEQLSRGLDALASAPRKGRRAKK